MASDGNRTDIRVNTIQNSDGGAAFSIAADQVHFHLPPPVQAKKDTDLSAVLFEGPGAVPATPVAAFTGRDEDMHSLLDHLTSPDEETVCVVAAGIGGVGKTSLARQMVATRAADLFPEGAAWLDGTNLPSELARVARRFGWSEPIDPTSNQAAQFLKNHLYDRAVLLVVDNVPEGADIAHLPIPGGKCRSLITSRTVSLAQDLAAPAATVQLEHWPPESCRIYLRRVVPRLATTPDAELDALSRFVNGLPLAVRLIARALGQNVARSPREHLTRLKAAPLGTLDGMANSTDRGVAATFLDAYRSLPPDHLAALRALAACARETRSDIVAAVAGLDVTKGDDALNALAKVSLASYCEGAASPWRLHDVVRLFVRAQPGSQDADSAHLAWVRAHLSKYSDPLAHEALDSGIAEAIAAFERLLAGGAEDQAVEILYPAHLHLKRRGRYAQAIDLAERLLAKIEAHSDQRVAAWLGNLGACYKMQGDIPKAIEFFKRSLAINGKMGSLEGQASQLGNLGLCYRTPEHIPKAIDFFMRALAIYERIGNLEGQAIQLGNLGGCYGMLREIDKAIDFLQRALAADEMLGRFEGQAVQLGNLGLCYLTRDIPKAIDFFKSALAINEKQGRLEGQAIQLLNLGLGYRTQGHIPEAIDFFQRSLAYFRKMGLPETHPSIALAEKGLADARAQRG